MLRSAATLSGAFLRTILGSRDIVDLSMRRVARRRGFLWGRTLYAALLFAIIAVILAVASGDKEDLPKYGTGIFATLATVQGIVALLFPPVLMAQTLAHERRRGTVGLLLLTHSNPAHVVRGLVTSRMLVLFAIFLGGAPVACMAAFLGGISMAEIVYLIVGTLAVATFGASIGAYLGADVSPRFAPFVAFVVSLLGLWFLYYPAIFFFVIIVALSSLRIPTTLIAVALSSLMGVLLLVFHRFMTREAGKALLRRVAEPSALPPAPPVPSPPTASAAVRSRPSPRSAEATRLISPAMARVPMRPFLLALLLAAAVAAIALSLPDAPGTSLWIGIPHGVLLVFMTGGGFVLLAALLLLCSIYPAVQIARFRSDATLAIVALAPIDLAAVLSRVERRVAAIAGFALVTSVLLLTPITASLLDRMALSALLLACDIGLLLALSFCIGAGARSVGRAMASTMVAWVVILGSLLVFAMLSSKFPTLARLHPLVAPFTYLGGGIDDPNLLLPMLLLPPIAYLLRAMARRRCLRVWREPFEHIAEEAFTFG